MRGDGGCAQCCYVEVRNGAQTSYLSSIVFTGCLSINCSKTAEIYAHASNNDGRYNNVWIHRVICNWSFQDGANIRGAIG